MTGAEFGSVLTVYCCKKQIDPRDDKFSSQHYQCFATKPRFEAATLAMLYDEIYSQEDDRRATKVII